ncbi:MAG: hypothetical protein WC788_01045 [Candidatus Paceibacterota bacterium]|jgi:hypothetical protein
MHVINIEKRLPDCRLCEKIEKEKMRVAQRIALFFNADALSRRNGHGFSHDGVMGIIKEIRKDDAGNVYSVKLENSTLSEFILSRIDAIILVCDECEKKYIA